MRNNKISISVVSGRSGVSPYGTITSFPFTLQTSPTKVRIDIKKRKLESERENAHFHRSERGRKDAVSLVLTVTVITIVTPISIGFLQGNSSSTLNFHGNSFASIYFRGCFLLLSLSSQFSK